MPRIKIKADRCKGCGLCVKFCAKASIRMGAKLNARGVRFPEVCSPEKCVGCRSCALVCPDIVIDVFK